MKLLSAGFAATLLLASPTAAQSLRDCDTSEGNARNIYGPYEQTIREFANGDIRLIALDEGPEARGSGLSNRGSLHIMVTYPVPDEPLVGCSLASRDETMGFWRLNMADLEAQYDPSIGLLVSIPVESIVGGDMIFREILTITVNRAQGRVAATLTSEPLSPSTPTPWEGGGQGGWGFTK
jgi:hypothetical protein